MKPDTRHKIPSSVLFACNMNAIRSPIAAALLRHLAGPGHYIRSAGVRPGDVDPFTVEVMKEIGIDITEHEPVAVSELFDSYFDLIITLTPEAHHQALELTHYMSVEVRYWPLINPALVEGNREQIMDSYRKCRDNLLNTLTDYFEIKGSPAI